VEALQGQGAYGAVYRAFRVGQEHEGPVALKLSLRPWNERFVREAKVLSRLSHPGFPRLLDRGALLHPSGAQYPFLVMQWVEGTPLYAWAERNAPCYQQVCRVLAQLARALQALHTTGAVHRDVKGDNVLVQLSDRLPVLLDFGSGHLQGEPRLTWKSLAPFTPEYLSPQAWRFHLCLARQPNSYYPPSPADDLYALGVTVYRLVMGHYPPPLDAREETEGAWHVSVPELSPLLERNARVAPGLRKVILQLLSQAPEVRGTAAQVAQALESLANEPVPQRPAELQPAAEVPLPDEPAPADGSKRPRRVRPPERKRDWKPWLALAAMGACAVLLWKVPPAPVPPEHVFANTQQSSASHAPDAGTAAVGDTPPTEPQAPTPPSTSKKSPAQASLPEPRPGQTKPDKKGRCPGSKQVPINGGCWLEQLPMTAEECVENDGVLFQGKCFAPVLPSPKKPQPTSNPPGK
jgi:serine/threonine protein kinase